MNNLDIKEPTEGEEYVMDFLKELGIKYEREKKIVGLKGDSRQFRIADFYLPQYNAYIEFFGLWNKNVKDDDYKIKRDIYRNNGIPCVYIYPENLGVLHFTFDKRLQKTLIENGKYKELKKYHNYKFIKARKTNLVILGFFIYWLIDTLTKYKNNSDNNGLLLFIIGVIGYQLYRISIAYISIYIKKKFSLLKVLDNS